MSLTIRYFIKFNLKHTLPEQLRTQKALELAEVGFFVFHCSLTPTPSKRERMDLMNCCTIIPHITLFNHTAQWCGSD